MVGSSRKSHLTAGLHAGSLDSVLGKALGIERALCGRGLHARHDAVAVLPGRQQVAVMEHQGVALNRQLSRLHCQLPAHQCRTCMSSSSQPALMSSTELSASPEPCSHVHQRSPRRPAAACGGASRWPPLHCFAGGCGIWATPPGQDCTQRGSWRTSQQAAADTHLGTQVATSAATGFLLLRLGEVDAMPVSHGCGLRCRWGPELYSSIRLCKW